MGSWGYYSWPREPTDAEWWEEERRESERYAMERREADWEARPTYEELMAMEDSGMNGGEIGEWQS